MLVRNAKEHPMGHKPPSAEWMVGFGIVVMLMWLAFYIALALGFRF
jgi:hypothetical protein